MGIFSFFIVLPEIAASPGLGWIMSHWLHSNRLHAMVAGGFSMLLAAVLMRFVEDPAGAGRAAVAEPVGPVAAQTA